MADNMKQGAGKSQYSTIWGLAKALCDKEELYALIYRETGKEHMTDMTPDEIRHIEGALRAMRSGGAHNKPQSQKRYDSGGNPRTIKMRKKIYMLTKTLDWHKDRTRIDGFCKRTCGVDLVEWLTMPQCSMVIEGLKKMIERMEAGIDEINETVAEGNS